MNDHAGDIHLEHPFVPPVEERDPARRFRGRLVAPVTVWTAGAPDARRGLTISSVLVADGEPPLLLGLVNDLSDLWTTIVEAGSFVVHVLDGSQRTLADRFALRRPAPGGLFAGLDVDPSAWGPVLAAVPTRAYCRLEGSTQAGHLQLVRSRMEELDIGEELDDPLAYFRGRYRRLDGR